ncbi:DNA-3-methyladenine glycosylase [Bradyrhizobium lupini]|uniref:DNA-3-methyladenine glycosylase n=1 Tax=Rhizobium lupini TaxID=136996 RepID=UPI0034C6AC74
MAPVSKTSTPRLGKALKRTFSRAGRARSDRCDHAGHGVGGIIVEVEAYHRVPSRRRTPRPDAAEPRDVRPAGMVYVYRSYGIHWRVNFAREEEARPAPC